MAQLRVFVADDYPEFVQKLVSLLEGRFEIVGTAADNTSAIDQIRRTNPDVAVLDVDMPPGNCIEMVRKLTEHQKNLRIVTCAYEENRALGIAAMQAGAIGFVSKERLEEDLALAVDSASRGVSFVSGESSSDGGKHARFFKELGRRVRELRLKAGYTQASMVDFGFSMRHWQQVEAGRPITVTTALRICKIFKIKLEELLGGLDTYLN